MALAQMGKLLAIIERLSSIPARTAVLAAPGINRLIREQFRAGVDPYGRAWADLRPATIARGRRPPPLTDTGKLRDGTRVRPFPGRRAGLQLVVGESYGRFHQTGTSRMVARRILPQQGMPRAWRAVLLEASRRACQDVSRSIGGPGE